MCFRGGNGLRLLIARVKVGYLRHSSEHVGAHLLSQLDGRYRPSRTPIARQVGLFDDQQIQIAVRASGALGMGPNSTILMGESMVRMRRTTSTRSWSVTGGNVRTPTITVEVSREPTAVVIDSECRCPFPQGGESAAGSLPKSLSRTSYSHDRGNQHPT